MEAATVHTIQDLERQTALPRKRKYTSKACSSCRRLKIRCQEVSRDDGTLSCEHCLKSGNACLWPEIDARKWSRIRSYRTSISPTNPSGVVQGSIEATEPSFQHVQQQCDNQQLSTSPQQHSSVIAQPDDLRLRHHLSNTPYTVVQYYRYLGSTAIAPGYKKISLKVAKDRSRVSDVSYEKHEVQHHSDASIIDTHTDLPQAELVPHILNAFFEYYGGIFCFLNRPQLEKLIHSNEISSFLLCSLAALSARFCNPEVFDPYFTRLPQGHSREKWEYSLPFLTEAKKLLMPLLSIPSCDLVAGLLFLALAEFGDNNEAGN